MSYTHLTINERNKIEVLLKENYSVANIAKILGYHRSTIYREINCLNVKYSAHAADKISKENSKRKGRKTKFSSCLKELIEDRLKKTWSPEQIVGRELKGKLTFKTIYNWFNKKLLENVKNPLIKNRKIKKQEETRGKFNIGESIKNRDGDINLRKEIGHWEIDTVVSARGKSKGCLATFAERKSRFYVALKMKDRSSKSMLEAIEKLTKNLPANIFKTMTSDRGKEFSCFKEVEELGIKFYFADAYNAGQRGTNENSNGLLRRFYPKKTDLSKINESELEEVLYLLNSRPRKCLNYATPFEIILQEIKF